MGKDQNEATSKHSGLFVPETYSHKVLVGQTIAKIMIQKGLVEETVYTPQPLLSFLQARLEQMGTLSEKGLESLAEEYKAKRGDPMGLNERIEACLAASTMPDSRWEWSATERTNRGTDRYIGALDETQYRMVRRWSTNAAALSSAKRYY